MLAGVLTVFAFEVSDDEKAASADESWSGDERASDGAEEPSFARRLLRIWLD